MLIYNVTTNIEASVHGEWLLWMQETHIPKVMATGKFLNAKMSRVLVEEDLGGITYSVQFTTVDKQTLAKYYADDATRLQNVALKRFPNKFVSFSTELQVISEHKQLKTYQNPMEKIEFLFTYGTLQDERLHHAIFQKKMEGFPDTLRGYCISEAKANGVYPMAEHTGNEEDVVEGIVYDIAGELLTGADEYEGDLYQRISVTLVSGKKAWVYITI